MTTTLSQINARVQDNLIDTPADVVARIDGWINDAQIELEDSHTFSAMKATADFTTQVGNSVLGVKPSDWLRSRGRVSAFDNAGRKVSSVGWIATQDMTDRLYPENDNADTVSRGAPRWILEEDTGFRVYPAPDGSAATGFTLRAGTPNAVVTNGSTLIALTANDATIAIGDMLNFGSASAEYPEGVWYTVQTVVLPNAMILTASFGETSGSFAYTHRRNIADGEYRVELDYWKRLPTLSASATSNWFSDNAYLFLEYRATERGMRMNRDTAEAFLSAAEADREKRRLIRNAKSKTGRRAATLVPLKDAYAVAR